LRASANDFIARARWRGRIRRCHTRKAPQELRWAPPQTIATLGTPQDVTAQELRFECFFPMDDRTANKMRAWGSKRR
jgi:hypothetical protein